MAKAPSQAAQREIRKATEKRDVARLRELAGKHQGSVELGCLIVEKLVDLRKYRQARELIADYEQRFPDSVRLRQLKGLALARHGHLKAAQAIFRKLAEEGHEDPETLGIYARTWMDLYDRTGRLSYLRRSRDLYARALELSPEDSYVGINAAAKSLLLGDREAADRYSRQVEKIVGEKPWPDDYWRSATVAEVQLLQGRYEEAGELYQQAVDIAPGNIGAHDSTWLQARRLMRAMAASPEESGAVEAAFRHLLTAEAGDAPPTSALSQPPFRRLRVYAFDPSLAGRRETAMVNQVTLNVSWEADPAKGPVGEYLEVIDWDPASDCFYEPVDLNDPHLLATDGLAPSDGNPRFHQQMVYAVAMNVIEHFEGALGRRVLWAPRVRRDGGGGEQEPELVRRLRIYPHALREANAYYSPERKALLFGYFPASGADLVNVPGGMVFTCLSHDIIAHELTHALLDGIHPRFAEPTNPDVLAFHEAFADVVALFQHFSHPAVLRHEIARTRADLESQSLLGQLAQEFGRALGSYGALRDALGEVDSETEKWRPRKPEENRLSDEVEEPHARGAILVAAIFDAFLAIYKSRVADLLRIATRGTGVLEPGALHPDLVDRLAAEAAKTATHLLRICIRALDYCPPVDVTFGDYLRAMITADFDVVPDDPLRYRLAIIEAFQLRGIYPSDVRNLAVESLVWRPPRKDVDLHPLFTDGLSGRLAPEWGVTRDRQELWEKMRRNVGIVGEWLQEYCSFPDADELGLALSVDAPQSVYRVGKRPAFEVHSVRLARRTTPRGDHVTDLVVEILQSRRGYLDAGRQAAVDGRRSPPRRSEQGDFTLRGGCTLIIDPETCCVRYAVTKHILSDRRLESHRRFFGGEEGSLRATYFGDPRRGETGNEPFALLHNPL